MNQLYYSCLLKRGIPPSERGAVDYLLLAGLHFWIFLLKTISTYKTGRSYPNPLIARDMQFVFLGISDYLVNFNKLLIDA